MRLVSLPILGLVLLSAVGCGAGNATYLVPARLDKGLVIILPGIEGESPLNHEIRNGLDLAGVNRALPIYSWGRPIPLAGPLINQMDFLGNRLAGHRVADFIVNYQRAHPGKPVHLVGHSGGGGVAVFAAEALPEGSRIDGLVLLSASISRTYNLTKALGRTRSGIVNYYSRSDVGILVIGTLIAGNVDGAHGPAAGALGFVTPDSDEAPAKVAAYRKLHQVELTEEMTGGGGAHASSTHRDFVRKHVAAWIFADAWPPTTTVASR